MTRKSAALWALVGAVLLTIVGASAPVAAISAALMFIILRGGRP